MKRLLLLLVSLIALHLSAQTTIETDRPILITTESGATDSLFKGVFYNETIGLNLHLNLYEESLLAPDMEFLGPVYGYMDGRIYGTWLLIEHKIEGHTAQLRFTNDIGSDSQTIRLTHQGQGRFLYEAIEGNTVRKVQGRKLVKIEAIMPMKRRALPQ